VSKRPKQSLKVNVGVIVTEKSEVKDQTNLIHRRVKLRRLSGQNPFLAVVAFHKTISQ